MEWGKNRIVVHFAFIYSLKRFRSLIDDNDEDDLPVPSVLAYVYRFPADDEDTDQHKAETNNESTQNSGCTVPDNAAPAQEFDPEKRESQPKHLTLVAEMRSETENKGSSGNVSDNGSSDTKDEVVSEWVQIGKPSLPCLHFTVHHCFG